MTRRRFKYFMPERQEFSSWGEETLLSVSEYYGVKPRSDVFEADEAESRASSLVGYRMVFRGDFVMNYMLAWKGAYGVSEYDGIVSPAYAVYKIDSRYADSRFIHYRLRSDHKRLFFRARSKGIIESRLRLYPDAFLSMEIDLPNIELQRVTASFLDRETERIDSLIEKKRRLLELAEEKRSALISAAVMGTGNPEFGEINSALEVDIGTSTVPIKRLFSVLRRIVEPASFDGEEVYHYSLPVWHELGAGRQENGNDIGSGKWLLEGGEILVSKLNPDKGAVILAEKHDIPTVCSLEFIALQPIQIVGRFSFYLMQSNPIRFQLQSSVESVTNSHKRARVDRFLSSRVVVPPTGMQMAIADFLDRETGRIEALKAKTLASIDHLREYRAALITAAVTGQIDVTAGRGLGVAERQLEAIQQEELA